MIFFTCRPIFLFFPLGIWDTGWYIYFYILWLWFDPNLGNCNFHLVGILWLAESQMMNQWPTHHINLSSKWFHVGIWRMAVIFGTSSCAHTINFILNLRSNSQNESVWVTCWKVFQLIQDRASDSLHLFLAQHRYAVFSQFPLRLENKFAIFLATGGWGLRLQACGGPVVGTGVYQVVISNHIQFLWLVLWLWCCLLWIWNSQCTIQISFVEPTASLPCWKCKKPCFKWLQLTFSSLPKSGGLFHSCFQGPHSPAC